MPIVNWIHKKKQEAKLAPRSSPYALILVPTRELCKQLYDEAVEFARSKYFFFLLHVTVADLV